MSMHYGLRKRITADELFDGRLEAFGVREEVRAEGTADRYPSYMKVKEVRYLTDGRNSMKVIVYESGVPAVAMRNPWCAPEGEIFYAIAKAFDSAIVSDQQPEFWGFDTQEEWDAWQTRRAAEEEQRPHAQILKFRGRSNHIRRHNL
jgi:hypothetical protein